MGCSNYFIHSMLPQIISAPSSVAEQKKCLYVSQSQNGVWLAMARILAAFTIGKAKDVNGDEIEPNVEFTTGLTRCVRCL